MEDQVAPKMDIGGTNTIRPACLSIRPAYEKNSPDANHLQGAMKFATQSSPLLNIFIIFTNLEYFISFQNFAFLQRLV